MRFWGRTLPRLDPMVHAGAALTRRIALNFGGQRHYSGFEAVLLPQTTPPEWRNTAAVMPGCGNLMRSCV